MDFIELKVSDGIATLTLARGKVNALNGPLIKELHSVLKELENDQEVRAVVLTGRGKFFSFGFDIPEFMSFSKAEFSNYLRSFTDLYAYIFLYPKPILASLNGHTIAGGCMLALACDFRVMASGKGKISLNEITFGSSVFAGSTELLRFWVGSATASEVLYSGAMYSAEEAKALGLIREVSTEEALQEAVLARASAMAAKDPVAFASIKSLLRKEIGDEMKRREHASIAEFVDIWYSATTRSNLQHIKINN